MQSPSLIRNTPKAAGRVYAESVTYEKYTRSVKVGVEEHLSS